MVTRVFLGWDRPFAQLAADWWLARQDELAGCLVVVPTSQSGRRFRERLVATAGALLTPKMVTPAWFLKTLDEDVAPDWVERLVWQETLESVGDWSEFSGLFPEAPEVVSHWAGGLAGEFTRLRRKLQEGGHTLASTARLMGQSVESGRWSDLAELEKRVEKQLLALRYRSRSRVLAAGVRVPEGVSGIVLAGVTEMPELVERAFETWDGNIRVLIAAPEEEAGGFSPLGRPLEVWSERHQPWIDGEFGSVRVAADAGQQAFETFRAVCEGGRSSDQVALGCADAEVAGAVARVFSHGGWVAFDPSAQVAVSGLSRFLRIWCQWLVSGSLIHAQDLLAHPGSERLVGGKRAAKSEALSRLKDQAMVADVGDVQRLIRRGGFRSEEERSSAQELMKGLVELERLRAGFLRGDFSEGLEGLLEAMGWDQVEEAEGEVIREWLEQARPLMERFERSPSEWLEVLLAEIPGATAVPPDGRVIDVNGWLELLFETGPHLVVCGMNEGRVPAASSSDPWLGEAGCRILGLSHQGQRAARDAFLHFAMIQARRAGGRVDLICAKSGSGGETLLPSRLLLAADRKELPDRVSFLFQEVEPPEAGLRWHADWKWQPKSLEPSKRLSATAFRDWLACPFRFYLKHSAAMRRPEPDRVEWNQRDFGNVAHAVLEAWGRDLEARDFSKSEALEDWFSKELDSVVAKWFGESPPLAVKLQTEALHQRFAWLAKVQAIHRAEGWEVIEVEHKFELAFGDHTVVAKIDRIDRHRGDGRLRVIDYKTGRVNDVAMEHRRKLGPATPRTVHVPDDSPGCYSSEEEGKTQVFRWQNLQLPLYACAIHERNGELPEPCYFRLGATEPEVEMVAWEGFCEEDLRAARNCAEWVVRQIADGVFWPPAEKVAYDDFADLTGGRLMEESFHAPEPMAATPQLRCDLMAPMVLPVSRPVDAVIEFLESEKLRGVSHILLDDGARDGLRELYIRAAKGVRPVAAAAANPLPQVAAVDVGGGSKVERLAALRKQAENWAPAKALGTLRDAMVFATGNPDARVVLVGEAPGYQEEKEAEPFVGPAGQKLNDILKAMGISREEVYISNIVKFRPAMPRQTTNNRKPTPEEMASCMTFIRQELAIIRPECVIALGGTAGEGLLGLSGSVTSMRGAWHEFEGIPTRVTYHPSYLLQSGGSNSVKRQVWEDMLAVMEFLKMPISEKQRGYFLQK